MSARRSMGGTTGDAALRAKKSIAVDATATAAAEAAAAAAATETTTTTTAAATTENTATHHGIAAWQHVRRSLEFRFDIVPGFPGRGYLGVFSFQLLHITERWWRW